MTASEVFIFTAYLFTTLYCGIILLFAIAWLLKGEVRDMAPQRVPMTRVSIIVAARNEEKNIANCLTHLIQQDYPKELTEIIVVDDNSNDQTGEIAAGFARGNSFLKVISLPFSSLHKISFKKQAITKAIKNASGNLIVTTDADCSMGQKWLSTLVCFYEDEKPKMIAGPVHINGTKNFFHKLQSLEYSGLMIASAGSIFIKKPLMCSGANLAYEKETFDSINGFEGIDSGASGDDVLLMFKIKKRFPEGIKFLKSKNAIVYTNAVDSLKDFFYQRLRWSTKTFSSKNGWNIAIAACIYFANLFFAGSIILSFWNNHLFLNVITLLIPMFIINFLFLFLGLSFFGKKNYGWVIFPEQFIYVFYISVMGICGIFKKKYFWKGREVY